VLRKNGASSQRVQSANSDVHGGRCGVLQFSLIAGDLALLFITWLLWKRADRPIAPFDATVYTAAVALGAWLTSLALWIGFHRE
jgi:hypothetical protein